MIKTTMPSVGPGSYSYEKNVGHKILNPTIPREPLNRSTIQDTKRSTFRKKGGNASIRDNFEDFSDDSDEFEHKSVQSNPGPGSYIKDYSTFGKTSTKSDSFQFFGSGVERFKHPHGSNSINAFKVVVGPGLYDSLQQPQQHRQKVFQFAGSASFVNSARKPEQLNENPGPTEYNPRKTGLIDPEHKTLEVTKAVFKSKIDRFHVPEMKKPDPGRYDVPGALSPNALIKNIPIASYRSAVKREV